jgi:hypothetical protein
MKIHFLAAVAFGVSLAHCAVGPRVENFKPAQQPSGVEATLNFDGATLKAELLEVRETALVVLNDSKVMLIPYRIIRRGEFLQTGISIREGNPPSATDREQLRLLSRFPQGLSPSMLNSLLAAYRQEKLTVLPQ